MSSSSSSSGSSSSGGGGSSSSRKAPMTEEEKEDQLSLQETTTNVNTLKIALESTRDLLRFAPNAIGTGFQIAKSCAEFGFLIGRGSIRLTADMFETSSTLGLLSYPLRGVDSVIGMAQGATLSSLDMYDSMTRTSLQAADAMFDIAGVEHGNTPRRLMEGTGWNMSEEAHAMVSLLHMVIEYTGAIKGVGPAAMLRALTAYSTIQWFADEVEEEQQARLGILKEDKVAEKPNSDSKSKSNSDSKSKSKKALSKTAASKSSNHSKDMKREQEEGISHLRNTLPRMVYYSGAAYGHAANKVLGIVPIGVNCNTDEKTIEYLTGVSAERDILKIKTQGDLYHPGYFLAVDRMHHQIVLSFRGTFRPQDILTDLSCLHEDFEIAGEKGFAHSGFLRSAQKVDQDIDQLVHAALQQHKGYQLVLTGHSLGAGVASMLAVLWQQKPEFNGLVSCYVFAPPCTLSLNLASHELTKSLIHAVVIGDDMVSRFGIATMKDLRDAIVRIARGDGLGIVEDGSDASARFLALAEQETGTKRKSLFSEAMSVLRSQEMINDKLFPAGSVLHLRCVREEQQQQHHPDPGQDATEASEFETGQHWARRDNAFFSELVISPTMFSVHMPQSYVKEVSEWGRGSPSSSSSSM